MESLIHGQEYLYNIKEKLLLLNSYINLIGYLIQIILFVCTKSFALIV